MAAAAAGIISTMGAAGVRLMVGIISTMGAAGVRLMVGIISTMGAAGVRLSKRALPTQALAAPTSATALLRLSQPGHASSSMAVVAGHSCPQPWRALRAGLGGSRLVGGLGGRGQAGLEGSR
jgi:hypothetical protein